MIELLAMSPSGEVYFTRDRHGVIWRHRRLGHHASIQVSEATVDWTVSHHGYDRCDRTFSNLVDAEAHVVSRLPTTTVMAEDLPVNVTIARSAVRVMERWLDSVTDVHLIVPTVNRLLKEDAVCADAELKQSLLLLSDQAVRAAKPEPAMRLLRPSAGQEPPAAMVGATAGTRLETTLAMYDLQAA